MMFTRYMRLILVLSCQGFCDSVVSDVASSFCVMHAVHCMVQCLVRVPLHVVPEYRCQAPRSQACRWSACKSSSESPCSDHHGLLATVLVGVCVIEEKEVELLLMLLPASEKHQVGAVLRPCSACTLYDCVLLR